MMNDDDECEEPKEVDEKVDNTVDEISDVSLRSGKLTREIARYAP